MSADACHAALVSADERAVPATGGSSVFSRAASNYNKVGPRHFEHFARRLVDLAGVRRGARVLDVATGTGAILLTAAERIGDDGYLVGVDVSEEMLTRAASAIRARGLMNAEVQVMDAQRLTFQGEFDYVFCGFALSSLPDVSAALTGVARALRPAGRVGLVDAPSWFFLHDPRWAGQAEVFRSFGVAVGDYEPDRERDDLVGALRRTGLRDITATQESCPLVFAGEDEWWTWMWSHGSRSLLEAVSEDQLESLKEALAAELPPSAYDGSIRGKLSAHVLLADAP